MSGSTIGGVVGGVVGFFFGNPQLGWMIGSAIGGYVDPEQISQFGPRLTDASQQTARDGIPIPYGYGTFPCHGNLIWCSDITEHVNESTDDGKGSGQEVTTTTYTYTRSYAIGICQGEIAGLLQIKRNGKVVWDTRTDEEFEFIFNPDGVDSLWDVVRQYIAQARAFTSRFSTKLAIYTGSNTQTADPTMEAHFGVGNVTAYRGLAYIVVTDDDVTELRGAVPQYEFVVATSGATAATPTTYHPKLYAGSPFPFRDNNRSMRDPRKSGVTYQYTLSLDASPTWYDSAELALAAAALGNDINGQPKLIESAQLMGWSGNIGGAGPGINAGSGGHLVPWDAGAADANGQNTVVLAYSRHAFAAETALLLGPTTLSEVTWARDTQDPSNTRRFHSGVVIQSAVTLTGFDSVYAAAAGNWYWYGDIPVFCRAVPDCGGAPEGFTEIPGVPDYYVNREGEIEYHGTCVETAGTFKQLSTFNWSASDNQFQPFVTRPYGPILPSTDANYSVEAYWTDLYDEAVARGILSAGLVYSADGTGTAGTFYPVSASVACACTDAATTLDPNTVLLSTIVAAEFQRVGLTASDYDVSQLTDEVLGYRVLPNGSGVDAALGPLMQGYFFDIAEWDGKLRCIKRGGASSLALTMDDLAERDGEAVEWTRVQEAELLRTVTVGYIDPAAGYTATTQKWERRAGTVQARGEAAVEIPITATADTAATIAKKRGLIAWAETEKAKLSLPYRRAAVTPTDINTLTDADGEAHRLRVGQIEDDSGVRLLEVTKERGNVYGATATGVTPGNPTAPNSTIAGPSILYAMNLPRLRSADSVPGVYLAVTGLMPGWKGADIYISADGGVTEQFAARVMSRATLGHIVSDITASEDPIAVEVYDNRTLSSVTAEQIAARQNAFAVTTDGTSEIGQFQTAAEDIVWSLSTLSRGQLGTTAATHHARDPWVLLDGAVQFLPLDISLAGKTLILRAVSLGTSLDDNATVEFTFDPQFTGPEDIAFLLDETGDKLLDESGAYLLE